MGLEKISYKAIVFRRKDLICDDYSVLPDNSAGFLAEIKNKINPMHFYCRERNIGIPKKNAIVLARFYEQVFFNTFFTNGHGASRISKLLKTLKI